MSCRHLFSTYPSSPLSYKAMSLCLSSFSSGVRRLDVRTGYTTTKVMERMLAEFTETILLLLVLLQSQSQGGKTQNERTELMRGRPSTIHAIETSTTISPHFRAAALSYPCSTVFTLLGNRFPYSAFSFSWPSSSSSSSCEPPHRNLPRRI